MTELKKTFFVAATSRPDLIDPAILRPGRVDCHIFCDLPNNSEREDYFTSKFKILQFNHYSESMSILVN